MAARILLDFDADLEKIHNEVVRTLPASAPGWLDGPGLMLNGPADEIRHEPDAGDLLLVLTAASDSVAAQALEHLGVDVDELWGQVERLRRQAQAADQQLADQIKRAASRKNARSSHNSSK